MYGGPFENFLSTVQRTQKGFTFSCSWGTVQFAHGHCEMNAPLPLVDLVETPQKRAPGGRRKGRGPQVLERSWRQSNHTAKAGWRESHLKEVEEEEGVDPLLSGRWTDVSGRKWRRS